MVQYKLNYFNLRARGEVIRYVLVAAGQDFEDNRIEFSDWPALKPNAPCGQLPFLEVTDGSNVTLISQSVTIARFLGKRLGLAGSNDIEEAQASMYADQVTDLINEMVKAHFEKNEDTKKELGEKLQKETIPNNMKIFEARLAANKGYLAGSGLTYADLHFYGALEWLGDKRDAVISNFPNVSALVKKISENEKIKAYIAKRPVTDL